MVFTNKFTVASWSSNTDLIFQFWVLKLNASSTVSEFLSENFLPESFVISFESFV